ncbi:T9SS type A sorting domain-containing protein [Reichenbachiella versicolor]|uniref:T9SS type A sorting domain-containing protein n=1 Tax=Reichenbachiella versicolor TaxID=1821036 RepID=UPI000D6E2298|nr:T9SS type A sorting domain-containing protein [Reichenbachiella versicolor]
MRVLFVLLILNLSSFFVSKACNYYGDHGTVQTFKVTEVHGHTLEYRLLGDFYLKQKCQPDEKFKIRFSIEVSGDDEGKYFGHGAFIVVMKGNKIVGTAKSKLDKSNCSKLAGCLYSKKIDVEIPTTEGISDYTAQLYVQSGSALNEIIKVKEFINEANEKLKTDFNFDKLLPKYKLENTCWKTEVSVGYRQYPSDEERYAYFDKYASPKPFDYKLDGYKSHEYEKLSFSLIDGFSYKPENSTVKLHLKTVPRPHKLSCSQLNAYNNARSLEVTKELGLVEDQTMIEEVPVDKDYSALTSLSLHPNPTNSVLFLDFGLEEESSLRVVVSDIQGRPVYEDSDPELSAGAQSKVIDVSGLRPGIYFLRTVTNEFDEIRRVVVE